MRIVAGGLGGRTFDSPGTNRTHPMSDKMRGALFNVLGDLHGLTVLDAFGGSGALSFEAVSRGAKTALVLDNDTAAQQAIKQNIAALDVAGQVTLVQAAAGSWLATTPGVHFDLVLCDPPYDDLQPTLLAQLAARVRAGGVFVLSYPAQEEPPRFDGTELLKQHHYGDAQLIFYRA